MLNGLSSVAIHIPKQYIWKPKEDITAYELALCLPMLMSRGWYDMEAVVKSLPDNAARHFEEIK